MEKNKQTAFGKVKTFIKKYFYFLILLTTLTVMGTYALINTYNPGYLNDDNFTSIEDDNFAGIDEVNSQKISFSLPVENITLLQDYSTEHIEWKSINEWYPHKAIDFGGTIDTKVFAIADGTITEISKDSVNGVVITITHINGFVSTYGSLAEDSTPLKKGDKVKKGDKIGLMGTSASNETHLGAHLHLVLYLNGVAVDPNLYLTISNK